MLYSLLSLPVAAVDPPATPTMATFLGELTSAFTQILTCVTEAATTIVGHPFLLFTVIFLFAGGVIGILGRVLSRN